MLASGDAPCVGLEEEEEEEEGDGGGVRQDAGGWLKNTHFDE